MRIVQIFTVLAAAGLWSGLRMHPAIAWLVAANVFGFILYGCDKFFAKRGWRRVSEADLLLYTLLGGTVGTWLGMRAFRHKTRKQSFLRSFGIIAFSQIGLVAVWLGWMFFR